MANIEDRLACLERRVDRYRNFATTLGGMLALVVTLGAAGVVPQGRNEAWQAKGPLPRKAQAGVAGRRESTMAEATEPLRSLGKVAAPAEVVDYLQVKRLELVNDEGTVLVRLARGTSGGGLVFLYNSEGKNTTYIGSSSTNGNGMLLVNSAGEDNLIALASNTDTGDGRILVRDATEAVAISLSALSGEGEVNLHGSDGERVFYAGSSAEGDGLLLLGNAAGKQLFTLSAGSGSGALWIDNTQDKNVVYLGADVGGQGLLTVSSKNGDELITAGSNTSDNGLFRVSNRFGNLEFLVVAGNEHGRAYSLDAQGNALVDLTLDATGNGLVQTWSPNGVPIWSSNFLQNGGGSSASGVTGDLDGDGDVDGSDFLIFSENYGKVE